ncbi:MAG: hypothetical protein HZA04_03145 [Nitrospinae bacterium]|nr:hypothetical protein [Nitrospinota bacterium]
MRPILRRAAFLAAFIVLWGTTGAYAVDLSKITFNGYLDLEYTATDNGDNPNQNNGSFHQHHLSFLLDVPVNDRVSVYTHIEFDHGTNTGVKNGGDIIVENAFIRYTFSDPLQFKFGKALTPFGYYNELHDATPAFISVFIPQTIYQVEDRGGRAMFPKWTTGVQMLGTVNIKTSVLDYVIYVGNGENNTAVATPTNEAEADDNRNKAFGARVNYQPWSAVQVGASYFTGEKATGLTQTVNVPHTTWALQLTGNALHFNFLGEYAVSELSGQRDYGMYGQFSWFATRVLTPYYRLEHTDPNNNQSGDTWTEHILGINIKPVDNLIFKAEVSDNSRGENYTPSVPHRNFREYRLAVAVYF